MRHQSKWVSLSLLLLILFVLPLSSTAQTFQANSSTESAKGVSYELDINSIHAYVDDQYGRFPISLTFSDTHEWVMEMERFDIRSNNYRVVTSRGTPHATSTKDIVTYKGSLVGLPDSEVRMTLTDGYFRAFVRESKESSYYLDMVDGSLSGSTVTIMQEDPDELPGACASGDEHHIHSANGVKHSRDLLHTSLAP
ncbi:MAG: hypothetical protein KTR29_14750 [Rhodothermaceae bacterium]|nr:hypothetical protein [Rhodothermaceae bacterium]